MFFKYNNITPLFLLLLLVLTITQNCTPNDQEFYISFHPHLDAFWLNTDDELKDLNFQPAGFLYAMNQRSSKQIFNSMYQSLSQSQNRKYFITEVVFFKDWYDYIKPEMRQKVKEFIKSGQLQIVNGGWVENDEAVCYVDDIIDQYTIGHNFLRSQFGLETKIGWATDSFGHSHSQVAIEHLLGFQAQGIERIDDRYIYQRKNGSLLQFYWSPVSDSNGHKYGGVFTHIRHFNHQFLDYRHENLDSLVTDYERVTKTMNKLYNNQKKLFKFVGNDFEEFIPVEFNKLQKTLGQLNANCKAQCPKYKYGNPTDYFKALREVHKQNLKIRQSDFMPNYDQDHYWSGYYTTNPLLKIICKDFSRIINLYRKIFVKDRIKYKRQNDQHRKLLIRADELLSVMQHHDGITATSKYHIQEMFKERMIKVSDQIFNAINQLTNTPSDYCLFDLNSKKCDFQSISFTKQIYLIVLHQGANKKQKIQLNLPKDTYFQAEIDKEDNIFCNQFQICTLVFEVDLKAGENAFKLNKITANNEILFKMVKQNGNQFKNQIFTVTIEDSTVKYSLKNGEFIHLSLVRSTNTATNVQTTTWNKFGQTLAKAQNRVPGIYIMANNGKLQSYPQSNFISLYASEGKRHIRFMAVSIEGQLTFTVDKNQPNILQVQTQFKPYTMSNFDYFIRITSPVKGNGFFYHDMNGYLVSKRQIGKRLDYEWNYRIDDKINANTYPMCSFGYTTDGKQKLVVFTDRAQGFTTYDDGLLINIDRLAFDDYKGVGQGYNQQIMNTFKHKIALIPHNEFVQRFWQRIYDQLNLGFLSTSAPESLLQRQTQISEGNTSEWIKYTIFSLNQNEFILRLFNMNENQTLYIHRYNNKQWDLPTLGLKLNFEDIVQTFANGNTIQNFNQWTKIEGQINIESAELYDDQTQISLNPLQIRSFRINLEQKIPWKKSKKIKLKPSKSASKSKKMRQNLQKNQNQENKVISKQQYLQKLSLNNPKPMKKIQFKTCM